MSGFTVGVIYEQVECRVQCRVESRVECRVECRAYFTVVYLLGTPVDTLLRVLRNNALLEAKHFACFVVNMSTLSC